ncbi:MAG: hypothetical protein ACOYJ6_13170 [Caulobacterales bacterium]
MSRPQACGTLNALEFAIPKPPPPIVKTLPELVRFLLRHLAIAAGVGLGLAVAFYALDIGSLRSLTAASRDGPLAMGVFAFAMVFTFGALGMGVGVMTHPRDAAYGQNWGRDEG